MSHNQNAKSHKSSGKIEWFISQVKRGDVLFSNLLLTVCFQVFCKKCVCVCVCVCVSTCVAGWFSAFFSFSLRYWSIDPSIYIQHSGIIHKDIYLVKLNQRVVTVGVILTCHQWWKSLRSSPTAKCLLWGRQVSSDLPQLHNFDLISALFLQHLTKLQNSTTQKQPKAVKCQYIS